MFSPLTEENMYADSGRPYSVVEAVVATDQSHAGLIHPVAGVGNAVRWPFPSPSGSCLLTFWGTGSAQSVEFTLQSDAVLRIVSPSGPIEVSVRRKGESILAEGACLDGVHFRFGLMAIPRRGTYCLVVHAEPGIDWGITVIYSGPAAD